MSPPTHFSPPDAPPVARPSAAHRWRNVGIFLAAVAGVHLVLDLLLPLPDLGKVSAKLAYFARHRDDYDAVFIGSSRVYRQIAPRVFDAQVAAATGQPIRSFNLGVPSMYLPESLFVLDRLFARRPARLRWMFIELDYPVPRLEEHAGLVQREVYWHGGRETLLTCTNILTAPDIHFTERLFMLVHQGMLFARCATHLGWASEWLDKRTSPRNRDAATAEAVALGPDRDGFNPYRGTLGQSKSASKDPVADTKNFLAAAAALRAGHARPKSPPASYPLRWVLAGEVRALRARGIEPLFVIPPVTTAEQEFLTMSKEGALPTLFAFNDPAAYPDLYRVDLHADTAHLNAPGSLLFTHLLAGKFADYRAAHAPR